MIAEIMTLAGSIIGSGAIAGTVTTIIYRKQNKKLKDDEVQKAATETDKQQIDLGDLFLEKTQKWADILESNSTKMLEKIEENNRRRDGDWERLNGDISGMKEDIGNLKKDIAEIKNEQRMEIKFLNGEYDEFKREMEQQA